MAAVAMRNLACRECGLESRHRVAALTAVFQRLPADCLLAQQIPYACPGCAHVGLCRPSRELKIIDVSGEQRHPDDLLECLVWLECDKTDCHTPIVIFAPTPENAQPTEIRAHIGRWNRADLRCHGNHRVKFPYVLAHSMIV